MEDVERAALRLMLVTDRRAARAWRETDRPLVEIVDAALDGGVTAVMLREHDLPTDALVEFGRSIADACRRHGALFVVNHDAEAAARLGADGVHLGFRSVATRAARAIVGERKLAGRSTHDPSELRAALDDGADYVTFGPVFDTPSKRGLLEPRGIDGLAAAVAACRDACRDGGRSVPVVALGGMGAESAARARRAGAAGIACIRGVLAADDPREAAARIRDAWERGA